MRTGISHPRHVQCLGEILLPGAGQDIDAPTPGADLLFVDFIRFYLCSQKWGWPGLGWGPVKVFKFFVTPCQQPPSRPDKQILQNFSKSGGLTEPDL